MSDTPAAVAPPAPVDKSQFWAETIAGFTASGLSVRAFCRSRGLHEKRFYTWRRHLGLSPVAPPGPTAPARPLIPVRVVPDPTAEVILPDGLTLRVPLAADPAHLARLVAALRDATC